MSVLIYSEVSEIPDPDEFDLSIIHNYKEVSMSNSIIRANQQLNMNEKRLICYCVSLIKKQQFNENLSAKEFLNLRRFVVSAKAFGEIYDYKSKKNVYRDLKNAAHSLYERSQHIRFAGEEESYQRFVDKVYYKPHSGEIELYFTPELYFHLCNYEGNFTQYNLKIGTNFKSFYAHRIFELLQTRKDTNCIIINIKDLRFALNIPDTYKTYAKLKEKVFEPTAKEFEKLGMSLYISLKKGEDRDKDVLSISTNKNVNDIVQEIGLIEENKIKCFEQPQVEVQQKQKTKPQTRQEVIDYLVRKYPYVSKISLDRMTDEELFAELENE